MDSIHDELVGFLKTKAFLDDTVELKAGDSLTEAGVIDSIGVLQLVDFIEEKYRIKILEEDITQEHFDTLGGIEKLIQKLLNTHEAKK